jgi:hypothetical protein
MSPPFTRQTLVLLGLVWSGLVWSGLALGQVPDRQIPPSVLSEVVVLQNDFEIALAADCSSQRCFSKGCVYVDHATADKPRSMSMPGLYQAPGPGSVQAQDYLTRARCSFAYELTEEEDVREDVQTLARRLQTKLSKGWTSVSVTTQPLTPVPAALKEAPRAEEAEDTDVPEPEAVEEAPPPATWARELWTQLLPHFAWMIAVVLLTVSLFVLIWAWRRVGRDSIEDRMLLAQIESGQLGFDDADAEEAPEDPDAAYVAEQRAFWSDRLASLDRSTPDPELQALIRELLRSGDQPLLAKAVLTYPDRFPTLFPAGGEVASAKLDLAAYLKTVDTETLPSDADFYRALNRHALAASVASQADARIVGSLREDFGSSGLATLIGRLPARPAGLVFALAPTDEQHEAVRMLAPQQVAEMAQMLLRSNRMAPEETQYLFEVLEAVRNDTSIPAARQPGNVSDRGAAFDAEGALSVLLEHVDADVRRQLFAEAIQRGNGTLPSWTRDVLYADLLFTLDDEGRADLMLELETPELAAWWSLLDGATAKRVLTGVPRAVSASVRASTAFADRTAQIELADRGRRKLARGLVARLARRNTRYEDAVVRTPAAAEPDLS